MAMTSCKECKSEISSKATTCPKCGAPIKRTSAVTKLVAVILALMLLSAIFSGNEKPVTAQKQSASEAARVAKLTPEQRKAEQEAKKAAEDLDSARWACKEFSKKALHDPSSAEFEPHKTYYAEFDKVTGIYKVQARMSAINGFGARRKTVVECGIMHKPNGDWIALTVNEVR